MNLVDHLRFWFIKIVFLAISKAVSMEKKISIDFFRLFLWYAIVSLQKCWIANASSQVFFILR